MPVLRARRNPAIHHRPSRRLRLTPSSGPSPTPSRTEPPQLAGDGRARRLSSLGIPAIGGDRPPGRALPRLARTTPRGPSIQNGGVGASPLGPDGGVGPGRRRQLHRHRPPHLVDHGRSPGCRSCVAATGCTWRSVRAGRRVRYTYEIVRTRSTSFRSPASLERQSRRRTRTPRRGHPPARCSRCRPAPPPRTTPPGNFWADEFDNPEHRIDKIGVLVARRTL